MWAELEHLFKRVPTMTRQQFRKHVRFTRPSQAPHSAVQIHKLGVDLSVEALDALFDKYDRDKSGHIDVYEYCAALMLGHPKEKCRAYDEKVMLQQQAEARKQKKLEGDSQVIESLTTYAYFLLFRQRIGPTIPLSSKSW